MKKELENKLVKEYPVIFKEYGLPPDKSCMHWGIAVGDGWFNIIKTLCEELDRISKEFDIAIIATQVKEKLGGLRFYYGFENTVSTEAWEKIRTTINKAEMEASVTCETCGRPGRRVGGCWIKTLCSMCEKKDLTDEE